MVWDAFGNSAKDTLFVLVQDTTPPALTIPNDVTYEIGSTGHQLAWSITDFSSGEYVIYRNGTQVASAQWNSGDTITINVDGLDVGVHNYTIVVSDVSGNSAVDTAFVTVVPDTTSPVLISTPANVTYEIGSTGHQLTWSANDTNPGTYVIYRNGTEVVNGTWASGEQITISLDDLDVGLYNFTIVMSDLYGNVAVDSTWVEVLEDHTVPTLTSPPDVTYTVGTTGHQLSWTATDLNPGTYVIYRNGTQVASGTWTSGDPITIDIDGLPVGSYNYTIVVQDQYGNAIADTVIVTVIETSSTTTTSDTGSTGTTTSSSTSTSSVSPAGVSTRFSLIAVLFALGIGAMMTRHFSLKFRRYK